MVNPNNSISRYPQEDAKETSRTKPVVPPGNDNFRKSMDGRSPGKDQEEQALAGKTKERTPSLFDLSSSRKPQANSSAIESPDSPVLPEPKTELTSSYAYEPQAEESEGYGIDTTYKQNARATNSESSIANEDPSFDNVSQNDTLNRSSERDVSDKADLTRSQRNSQELADSNRNVSNDEQKHSKKNVKTADLSQNSEIQTKEQQQLRIKKQQIQQQQKQNPQMGQTQTASQAPSGSIKGLKDSSFEAPLEGSSEELSLESHLNNSFGAPLKPVKGDERFSLQDGGGDFQFDAISPTDEFGAQLARLDSPENQISETIVGGTIQKNLKSDAISKKEMMDNSGKLIAGLDEAVAESKGNGGDLSKDKTKSQLVDAKQMNIEAVPTIQTTPLQTEIADTQQPLPLQTTEELATQIISHIQTLTTKDEMRTTVTLKQPPLLEGATITLTASNNAKKEFNISIANLSPEAKTRLDVHLKENSLIDNLGEKGITVHMLTTTTQVESFVILDDKAYREQQEQPREQQSQPNERRRDEEGGQQGRQQKRQRNQENDDEEAQ